MTNPTSFNNPGPSSGGAAQNAPAPGGETPPNPFVSNGAGESHALPGFGVAAAKRSPVSIHTALVGLVLVIAAVAIFGMRKIGLGNLKAMGSTTAAVDLSDVPRADNRHVAVIEALNRSRSENQVELDHVKKNPFVLDGRPEAVEKPRPSTGDAEKDRLAMAADARKRQLATKLREFTLNSVMGGARPVARINGRLVHAGEKLDENFRVLSIAGRSVELEADGQTFTLELGGREKP